MYHFLSQNCKKHLIRDLRGAHQAAACRVATRRPASSGRLDSAVASQHSQNFFRRRISELTRVAGRDTSRAASRTASRVASRTAGRVASRAASRVAGRAASRVAGRDASRDAGRDASRVAKKLPTRRPPRWVTKCLSTPAGVVLGLHSFKRSFRLGLTGCQTLLPNISMTF